MSGRVSVAQVAPRWLLLRKRLQEKSVERTRPMVLFTTIRWKSPELILRVQSSVSISAEAKKTRSPSLFSKLCSTIKVWPLAKRISLATFTHTRDEAVFQRISDSDRQDWRVLEFNPRISIRATSSLKTCWLLRLLKRRPLSKKTQEPPIMNQAPRADLRGLIMKPKHLKLKRQPSQCKRKLSKPILMSRVTAIKKTKQWQPPSEKLTIYTRPKSQLNFYYLLI